MNILLVSLFIEFRKCLDRTYVDIIIETFICSVNTLKLSIQLQKTILLIQIN